MFLEFLEIFMIAAFAIVVVVGHVVAEMNSRKRAAEHAREWRAFLEASKNCPPTYTYY